MRLFILACVLVGSTCSNAPFLFSIFGLGRSKSNSDDRAPFLPKLLPHDDKCYLMEFHHDDCDHAEQMEPVLQRLEEDLDTKIRRINISRRREFYQLLHVLGHDECGSFPFYYNRRTGQAICGATSYINLRSLGQGEVGTMFHEPPENIHDREGRGGKKTEVGFKGFLADKFAGMDKKKKQKQSTIAAVKTSAAPNKEINDSGKNKKVDSKSTSNVKQITKPKKASSNSNSGKKGMSVPKTAAERLEERKLARAMKQQQENKTKLVGAKK